MIAPARITRGTAFRLARWVTVIVTCINLAIFCVLYLVIGKQLTADVRAHVDEVRKTLVDLEGQEPDGFSELSAMVSRRSLVTNSDEDIYLLTDKQGVFVAGNVKSMPRFEGWRLVKWNDLPLIGQWSDQRASTGVIGTWTTTRQGFLFVGDGNGNIVEAQRLLLNGLLWGIALSMVFAIVGGYLLGLRTERRIAEMETVLNSVASGELRRRVPRRAASDDIDHVAALINSTLDRLQRLISNLQQVSTDIAHDLRTPISRMRQKVEIAQTGPADIAIYQSALDEVVYEIDNISDTFDSLLRISEIEAGARKTKFAAVNLKELLTNIVDALDAVADEHGHRLTCFADVKLSSITGDRRLLNQMFLNIIENAIVHCPNSSKITVELSDDHRGPIVKVIDTGCGIPLEEREKVFRRLYRLERSRTSPGNGLGLSLVAAIAELHGATIALADNSPGLVVEIKFGSSALGHVPSEVA